MDQLYNDTQERTWEDYIETAGAVLAVGAGAAFFLRKGGYRQLAKASTFIDTFHSELSNRFLDRPIQSFDTIENTIKNNFSDAYKTAMRDMAQREARLSPVQNGVIGDIFQAIQYAQQGKSLQQIKNDILAGQRSQFALNIANNMQEYAINNAPETALNDLEYNVLERTLQNMTRPNDLLQDDTIQRIVSEAVEDEDSYQKVLQYARAIQDELSRNKVNIQDKNTWHFTQREFIGFAADGTGQFGKTFAETKPDFDIIGNAFQKKVTDWEEYVNNQIEDENWYTRFIDDVKGKRVSMGQLMDAYENHDPFAEALFDSRNAWAVPTQEVAGAQAPATVENPLQFLRKYRQQMSEEERKQFDRIRIDEIRIQDGHLYTTDAVKEAENSLMEELGNLLPGRMMRLNDSLAARKAPITKVFAEGTWDPVAARALGLNSEYLDRTILYHQDRFYEIHGDSMRELKQLRDYTIRTSRSGSQAEIYKTAFGASERIPGNAPYNGVSISAEKLHEEYGNNFDFFLGANKDKNLEAAAVAMEQGGRLAARVTSRKERLFGSIDRYVGTSSMDARAYSDFHKWYQRQKQNKIIEDSTLDNLFSSLEQLSKSNGEEEIQKIMGQLSSIQSTQGYYNPKLKRLISDYWKDPKGTSLRTMTGADLYKIKDATAYQIKNLKTNLTEEMTKELFIHMENNKNLGSEAILDLLDETLRGERKNNMRNLAGIALFDQRTWRNLSGTDETFITQKTIREMQNISSAIAEKNATKSDTIIADTFDDLYRRFNFPGEAIREAPGKNVFRNVSDYHFVHKAYTFNKQFKIATDIIAGLNETTKTEDAIKISGRALRELVKPLTQFISGNDRLDAYSTLSHGMFHAMKRVNDQLKHNVNIFGYNIGFDFRLQEKHQTSASAILAHLVLRRVAPLGIGLSYLDWLDDASKSITGTGLAEAGASGLANMYLGVKKFTSAIGMDNNLKSFSSDNVFFQYWSGATGAEKAEWNTYEEEKDYYERGYTAIRKNRNWWFGSSNEYRGNRIAYFEPNTLRMLRSNYYMESMYNGSMWDKWSHSLLPTPTNPLSPLLYLIDPYYLENMHAEDRPYPVSGSTFTENTPWGIALNPIFDTFVKPRKELHPDRLGSDGVDVKALIAHVNNEIKRRSMTGKNEDIIYLQNGKLRSMLFTAFNAPTPSQRIISADETSVTAATEYGVYGGGLSGQEYMSAKGISEEQEGGMTDVTYMPAQNATQLNMADRLIISAGKGNFVASQLVSTLKQNGVFSLLQGANESIRQKGSVRKDLGFFYENKMRYEQSTVEDMLADADTIADLMTAGKGHDYIHEMAVSARNITGLYGYLASTITGAGENNQKRIATSQNMESFSRKFWDMNLGALDMPGSDIMEIARRFVPNYQRQAMVNPLMNNMPDWLPEKFRFGDPFASIIRGEARLPGRGYESLNQLHGDMFGRYGAFDRFKILADIAPYSPEYKFWKKVATSTIQDPELKQEIQEIKERVAEQTKGRDFYDYHFVGRDVNYGRATITEILSNGKFKINGSDQIYKLSGVRIKAGPNGESTQEVLGKYIHVGQEVSLGIDENPYYAQNNDTDRTINAAIIVDEESIAQQMMKAGDARKRKGDMSASSYMPNHGLTVNMINTITEFASHADVPVMHSRFFKIETPLESYLDDNVYGTSYQSWTDPWGTYIRPNFQKMASSPTWLGIGIAAEILNNNIQNRGYTQNTLRELTEAVLGRELRPGNWTRRISKYGSRLLNRGQLFGSITGGLLWMGSGGALQQSERMGNLGSLAALGYVAMDNPDNLAVSTMAWSRLGWKLGEIFMPQLRGKAALAGAAIGIARWLGSNKLLSDDDLANRYIPEETRKRWDMQDYFDRLTYIKYSGLYEQAADKALEKEGVNIRAIIAQQEQERAEIRKTKEELRAQLKELEGRNDIDAIEARKLIRQKEKDLVPTKLALKGGQWTKSAIMYKNASDATMYGLDENAVMADIVRALPKTERDYFIEFIKERDPEKRKEILASVSPLLNRALRMMWKMPLKDKIDNAIYFTNHTLPAPTWSGWDPHVDLANVEAKVIYNQGMLYSDMGVYASEYRTPEVQNAPNIEYSTEQNSALWTRIKLQAAITGSGLNADEISIEQKPDSGIQVIANVTKIIPYKIQEEINNVFNNM